MIEWSVKTGRNLLRSKHHRRMLHWSINRNICNCMGGPTCRNTTMCAASAAKRLQYFCHSKNLKRSRLSDVPSVRAIRSKSRSRPSLQRQARNHNSHVLPVREIFCILSPNTTLQMKISRFPFIYKLYKFIIIFKLQMVVLWLIFREEGVYKQVI